MKNIEDYIEAINYGDADLDAHLTHVMRAKYEKEMSNGHKDEDAIVLSLMAFMEEMARLGLTPDA